MPVFHLKYRPQRIGDLDLPEVGNSLRKILEAKEIPQSILFSGPKGSGKTSAARILARAVNCVEGKGVEPCNECVNCKEILKGNSLDIIEIDAASNRGIDDVRGLREGAYLSPTKLKKKVVIIDEVHMLTREAFNALLKLLEEPPKNVFFVLCTTDEGKIPETVMSRLTKISFTKGNKESLYNSLQKIIDGEKIKIDPEALDLVISRSDGSFRNLQRTFNEIFLETGKKIGFEDVKKYFGKIGDYEGEEIERDLAGEVVGKILEKLEKLANFGTDFGDLRQRWILYFQNRLLSFYGVGQKDEAGLDLVAIKKWLSLLIEAGTREKLTDIGQLPLQLAVVEFLGKRAPVEVETPVKVVIEKPKVKKQSETVGVEEVLAKWPEILSAVKPYNHSVEAFLRAARPGRIDEGTLVLEVFYKFHKERLEEPKNRKIVELALGEVLGGGMEFECVLTEGKKGERIKVETAVDIKTMDNKEISDFAEKIFS